MAISRILVVDDSPTERFFLSELLVKNGYLVSMAESGEEAVAQAKQTLPDLIVMDVVMPGMNGYQATRMISKEESTKHIPVIMCTTKGQETDKVWGMRQGAKAYIKNLGFMGEKYVGLTSGEMGTPYLGPGAVLTGQEPPNFDRLLTEGQAIAAKLKSISTNIDERLQTNGGTLDETLTNLNLTMKDLAAITSNINERLSANDEKIDDTVTNLHALSVNLQELSYDLKLNPWKLMYRGKGKKERSEEE